MARANHMWPVGGTANPAGRTPTCTGNLDRKLSKAQTGQAWILSPKKSPGRSQGTLPASARKRPPPATTEFPTAAPHFSVCPSPWGGGGQAGGGDKLRRHSLRMSQPFRHNSTLLDQRLLGPGGLAGPLPSPQNLVPQGGTWALGPCKSCGAQLGAWDALFSPEGSQLGS